MSAVLATWAVTRAHGLHAWRNLSQAGQRSLATLFVLPLALLGLALAGLEVRDAIGIRLTGIPVEARVEAWVLILDRAWICLAFASSATCLLSLLTERRAGVLKALPVSRAQLAAARAAPWVLGSLVILSASAGLCASAMGSTLGFYRSRGWSAGVLIALHFTGAAAVGAALPRILGLGLVRLPGTTAAAVKVALALVLCAGVAFAAGTPSLEAPSSIWTRGGLQALFAGDSTFEWSARLAAIPIGAGAFLAACAILAPDRGLQRGASVRRAATWKPPRPPWRTIVALDLRLLRRESAGLATALTGQVAWIGSLLFLFGAAPPPEVREATLENVALALPAFWGSLAIVSPALALRGTSQLLAAPVGLLERSWGQLCAAFTFALTNWLVGVAALCAAFQRLEPCEGLGRGVAVLALSTSAGYLAGFLIPLDLRAGFSGLPSACALALSLSFLAVPTGAVLYLTRPLGRAAWVAQLQIVLLFTCILVMLRAIQREYLRHGFRP